MRCFSVLLCLFFVLPCLPARAQTPAVPATTTGPGAAGSPTTPPSSAAAISYADEALVFEHFDTTVRMRADGTGERIDHVVLRAQSEGAVRAFGVLAISYASANSTATIEHVVVHKADGSDVPTPAGDAMEVTEPVTREAPMYSDMKQVQLPIRSLSAGDRLEYDLHTVFNKPEAPGQFWGAERILPFAGVMLSRTVTLEVPAGKYVQVWSPKHPAAKATTDGMVRYRWTTSQLTPTPKADGSGDDVPAVKDPDEDADGRKLPSIAWTTFHNWSEVGDWYRGLALQRAQPDAALRAKAEALTKEAKTPQDQVQALYDYVSAHVRYVGIALGVGRFQPHVATEVLSNQYGDCKDKDTLLEALLRARGFAVSPALIGAGITPVPDVPSPAVFNHVITTVTLPSGRIWLDSTAEVGPFQYLVPPIRDQEALVVPEKGEATLVKTPPAPPYAFTSSFSGKGEISADATMHASMSATYRGDDEIVVRALARNLAPAEWDKGSQYISNQMGFGGTTSNTRFKGAGDLDKPIELSYDYTRKQSGNPEAHQITPLFPAVTLLNNVDSTKAPEHDLELGVPRKDVAVSRIRIPAGWHADLPNAIHEQSKWAEFDKTYRFVAGEIITERTVTVLQPKVPRTAWKDYQAFCKRADLGNENWITLLPVTAETTPAETKNVASTGQKDEHGNSVVKVDIGRADAVPEAPADASVDDLKATATRQLQNHQVSAARATLDRVRQKDPKQDLVLFDGWIAELNGNWQEAIVDYKKQLGLHPDQTSLAQYLAGLQHRHGESAEAQETLETAFRAHPGDMPLGLQLANLQSQGEHYAEAVSTLESVTKEHPEDLRAKVALGNALLASDRKDEAAAAAKAALDGTTEPGILNDAGYLLAETGRDLPEAESVSRKSIATLEEKSRAITPDQVNSNSFAESNLLIAAWDTLGWILFHEGKLDQAELYIQASWRNALHPEVGEHLGRVLEQRGDLAAATEQYRDAQAAIEGENASPAVRKGIDSDLVRMHAATSPDLSASAKAQVQAIRNTKGLSDQQRQELEERAKRNSNSIGNSAHVSLQDQRTYHVPRPEGAKGWGTLRLQLRASGVQAVEQSSGDSSLSAALPALRQMQFPGLVPAGSEAYLLRSGVLSCSQPKECELVLVPNGSLQTEMHE